MDIKNHGFTSIEQVTGQYFNQTPKNQSVKDTVKFEDIFLEKVEESSESQKLKFSKHANKRLLDRNINLSDEQMTRLEKGAMLSNEKGIKESLVIMDELSFIVNTKSNTVVTAMQNGLEGENVYTNIDGAVLV